MPATSHAEVPTIETEEQLEEVLSRPTQEDAGAVSKMAGDLLILGVSGKMGPTMMRLARRACEKAGVSKRVVGVARFSSPGSRQELEKAGVETIACDLLDRSAVDQLPDCANVLFMVGQKFGTQGNQPLTWAINSYVPAIVAERFRDSRIVSFSTGNVYPLTTAASGGPVESDSTGPVGEYAQSALARERIWEFFSARHGTEVAILRLNYAIDLRYGVLRDIAERVFARKPVSLSMGHVNVIWQRDANSVALRSFAHCASPPFVLNLTGAEMLSVRKLAGAFGKLWGIVPIFEGRDGETALLSNAKRCGELFDPETVSIDQMISWVAGWVERGGRDLGKPTHFEARDGSF
jgi:nucleoside-diphosphate-sugar epimerase